MAKSDAIFNLGLLATVGIFGYLFAVKTGLFTPNVPTERGGSAACPKGKRYPRGFFEGCEVGYHQSGLGFGNDCECDNIPAAPTTLNVQPIPPPVIAPSVRSCEQAGYPPPCVRPDLGTTAATPYLEQPGMPFDPCIQNPLSWGCIIR